MTPPRDDDLCRLRWNNHLDPSIELITTPLTDAEQDFILSEQRKQGNKWTAIARLLHGRTSNNVVNFWNSKTGIAKRKAQGNN
jgi:myb proto-oncogene protein